MGEVSKAPLAAATAAADEERKEVVSPLAGGPVREVSKDPLGPGAAPQEGAVASPWAGQPGEEASEAPLGPAAAPEEEEVASPLTAEPLREDSTDLLSPAAAAETGAVASPLVPGHQVSTACVVGTRPSGSSAAPTEASQGGTGQRPSVRKASILFPVRVFCEAILFTVAMAGLLRAGAHTKSMP